jgi:hypothetical protein
MSPSSSSTARRSRSRRMGESVYGVLLLAKNVSAALIALLLLCAGGWASWLDVEPAVRGHERGVVRVEKCGQNECDGRFRPTGSTRVEARGVTLARPLAGDRSGEVPVALRADGTHRVVRTDPGGLLYASIPLGGALLLASLVVAGGLRMKRTALAAALLGAAILGGAWALLTL